MRTGGGPRGSPPDPELIRAAGSCRAPHVSLPAVPTIPKAALAERAVCTEPPLAAGPSPLPGDAGSSETSSAGDLGPALKGSPPGSTLISALWRRACPSPSAWRKQDGAQCTHGECRRGGGWPGLLGVPGPQLAFLELRRRVSKAGSAHTGGAPPGRGCAAWGLHCKWVTLHLQGPEKGALGMWQPQKACALGTGKCKSPPPWEERAPPLLQRGSLRACIVGSAEGLLYLGPALGEDGLGEGNAAPAQQASLRSCCCCCRSAPRPPPHAFPTAFIFDSVLCGGPWAGMWGISAMRAGHKEDLCSAKRSEGS